MLAPTYVAIILVAGLVVFMMAGIPIVYSLGLSSVIALFLGYGAPGLLQAGSAPFTTGFAQGWTALPLFVFLGTIISASGMGEGMFKAAANWLSRIRGGLVAGAIVGEGVLAAALGTSAATIIVVGKTAVPEFKRQGYSRGFSLGALLAGGALGPLIPPSATFIIVGNIAGLSIGKLFMAGILPGILMVFLLAIPAIIMAYSGKKDHYTGKPVAPPAYSVPMKVKLKETVGIIPIVAIMTVILVCIYKGIATPTETAGVGAFFALVIAFVFFKMRWKGLKEAMTEAALINGMILIIMFAAKLFTFVLSSAYVTKGLINLVEPLSGWQVILMINIIVILLGCFIDPITITLLTIPIFLPLVKDGLGMDPIWFVVMFCCNTQIGLITPPMGTDLFAVKTIFKIPTGEIVRGVLPFIIMLLVHLALIALIPEISTWLPNMSSARG